MDDDDDDAEYLNTNHEEGQFVGTVKGSKQSTEYEVNNHNSGNGRRRIKSLICQQRHKNEGNTTDRNKIREPIKKR